MYDEITDKMRTLYEKLWGRGLDTEIGRSILLSMAPQKAWDGETVEDATFLSVEHILGAELPCARKRIYVRRHYVDLLKSIEDSMEITRSRGGTIWNVISGQPGIGERYALFWTSCMLI